MSKHSYQAVPTSNKEDAVSSADDCARGIPLEDIESLGVSSQSMGEAPPSYHPRDGSHSASRVSSEDKLQPVLGDTHNDKTTYYIHGQFDEDPVFLEHHVRLLASDPPRCWVTICMAVERGPSKIPQPIALKINMTSYLFNNTTKRDWHHVSAVGAYEWVRRGSLLRGRAQDDDDAFTDVGEWCRRFSASSCGLKVLSVERRIVGCDWNAISDRLKRIVWETGYTGNLKITREEVNMRSEIHNQCHTNYWRTRAKMPFWYYASLIFLLCRLWLFLRTRYWDTIRADWRVSRVVVSEDGGQKKEYVSSLSETELCDSYKDQIQAFIAKQQAVG